VIFKPRVLHLPEPELEFRYAQPVHYPRDGLYLFGPVDAAAQPRRIHYGVIGTPFSLDCFREWANQVASYIDVPPPRPGAKPVEPHHVPFPGFSEAFFATWPTTPPRTITDIDEVDLRRALNIANRNEAIKEAVTIFVERLIAEHKRDEDPPSFWYVVIPEFVYEAGRPQSKVPEANRVRGSVLLTEKQAAELDTQPTLFGEAEQEAEVFLYARNFRRQLKARLLDHQIVTQIVRETTLTPHRFLRANQKDPKRRVEDAATIAWKLCTTSYYKSGGKPWQLAKVRPGVCYVGLVYKRQPKEGDERRACCAAQMFLSDGEGVVFRGALGPWYQPNRKQCHLDRPAARNLAEMVLGEYRRSHNDDPAELFIHAKSSFSNEEWAGFEDTCRGKRTNLVGVQIADAWDSLKLFRPGAYPTLRGTALQTAKWSAFLWTSGYVPRLDTYMGPDTPNPVQVSIRRGEVDLQTVLADVLSLTKINFNTCLFNDRSPVTIRFADAIGDILVAAPLEFEPRLPFKFYI
jgi:hypothetical protein